MKAKEEIEILRERIDMIDIEIVDKLAERMRISEKIGQYKKEHNMAIHQEERFKKVIENITKEANEKKISAEFICAIYKIIHSESKKNQL